MSSDFNLRAFVTSELRSSPVADPSVIAEHIAKMIPDEHLRSALAETLRGYVGDMSRTSRNAAQSAASPTSRWEGPAGAGAIYDAWRNLMSQREKVTDADSSDSWRFIGDMTKADVLAAADVRRTNAIRNAKKCELYVALAALMTDDGQAVRDLPQDQVLAVFS